MTVRDLIAQLSEYGPDLEVVVNVYNGGDYRDAPVTEAARVAMVGDGKVSAEYVTLEYE